MPHDPYAELVERLNVWPGGSRGSDTLSATYVESLMREAATALARLSAPVMDAEVEAMAKIIFDSAVGLTQWDNEFYAEEKQGCRTAARAALAAHRAGRGM